MQVVLGDREAESDGTASMPVPLTGWKVLTDRRRSRSVPTGTSPFDYWNCTFPSPHSLWFVFSIIDFVDQTGTRDVGRESSGTPVIAVRGDDGTGSKRGRADVGQGRDIFK